MDGFEAGLVLFFSGPFHSIFVLQLNRFEETKSGRFVTLTVLHLTWFGTQCIVQNDVLKQHVVKFARLAEACFATNTL